MGAKFAESNNNDIIHGLRVTLPKSECVYNVVTSFPSRRTKIKWEGNVELYLILQLSQLILFCHQTRNICICRGRLKILNVFKTVTSLNGRKNVLLGALL